MSFPKSKRRNIVVDGMSWEWCCFNGVLYYKNIGHKSFYGHLVNYGEAITPKTVENLIRSNKKEYLIPSQISAHRESLKQQKIADKAKYKLYVWEGVLNCWTSGIMFAFARNVKEAREYIAKASNNLPEVIRDLKNEPQVFSSAKGFYMWGSN